MRRKKEAAGLRVATVHPGSISEELGWEPDDRVLSINGEPVRDPLDYRFLMAEEEVLIHLQKADGELVAFEIEKDEGDELGVDFDPISPDRCGNQCTFCFVHQMPRGMRRSLYIKDEDFRLSFLAGHFSTMATITDAEMQRIARQRLSPQYISVHATDEARRKELLGNPTARPILETIDWFLEHGVEAHTQIVLIPGENDGAQLDRSLEDLLERHPGVRSVGIVPVGLTRYREKLPSLQDWSQVSCAPVFEQVDRWQERSREQLGENILFLADEFYVLAGLPVPPAEHYGEYEQLGNGVGMIRQFLDGIQELEQSGNSLALPPFQATLITGKSAAPTIEHLARLANASPGVQVSVLPIENRFFGSQVTCAGLLTGGDILEQVGPLKTGALILPDILRGETPETRNQLLDDKSLSDLAQELNRPVFVIPHTAQEAWEELGSIARRLSSAPQQVSPLAV